MPPTFLTELSIVSRKIRTLFDGAVRTRGLNLARARLLLHLSRNRAVNQKELAGFLELEPPTLVRLLDALEKQGLIARNAVEGDRRAKEITLTALAAPLVDDLEDISRQMESSLLHGVSREDAATARRVLARIGQNIEAGAFEGALAAIRNSAHTSQ